MAIFRTGSLPSPDGFAGYLAQGWGYGFAVLSRLVFFNLFLLVPMSLQAQVGWGHTAALAASIAVSAALAWGSLRGVHRHARALAVGSSLLLAVALGLLTVPPVVGNPGAALAAYVLGGAGMVSVNVLWETSLSKAGIRAAFTERFGGTILGSLLFFLMLLSSVGQNGVLCAVLCVVSPLVSGVALIARMERAPQGAVPEPEENHGVSNESVVMRGLPVGTFAIVMLAYVAFGTVRMTVTSGDASRIFAEMSILLPLLTVASVGVAVRLVLCMRRLDVSRIVEVAAPIVAVSVALPVFGGPFSTGVVSYLLVYAGCEVLFLFAWIPVISFAENRPDRLLFCFSLLGLAQWAGSLAGNGIFLVAQSYSKAATVVLLAVVACLLVAMRSAVGSQTVTVVDAGAPQSSAPESMSVQERCDLLGEQRGLSSREMEVCYLWVTGHTAPFIQERLVISKSTVKTHLSHIYEKTGVRTKEQLIQLVESVGNQG